LSPTPSRVVGPRVAKRGDCADSRASLHPSSRAGGARSPDRDLRMPRPGCDRRARARGAIPEDGREGIPPRWFRHCRRSWSALRLERLATAASSLSRSEDDGAGGTEASPAPLAFWRFATLRRLTGPLARAALRPIRPRFASRLRRGAQRGAIAPHLRRFDPIDRSSRFVGPIDPDGIAALA
jgi:hypothetical protein